MDAQSLIRIGSTAQSKYDLPPDYSIIEIPRDHASWIKLVRSIEPLAVVEPVLEMVDTVTDIIYLERFAIDKQLLFSMGYSSLTNTLAVKLGEL